MNISIEPPIDCDPHSALFQKLPFAVFILDRSGMVVDLNKAARDMVVRCADHVPDFPWPFERIVSARWPQALQNIQTSSPGDVLTLPLLDKDNERQSQRFSIVTPLPAPKGQPRRIALLHSESDPVTKVFAHLNHKLETANTQALAERHKRKTLEDQYAALQDFSHVAAHDLKSPLSSISQALDLFRDNFGDLLPEQAHDILSLVQKSCARLVNLIGSLLEFGQAGILELRIQDLDLNDILRGIAQEIQIPLAQVSGKLTFPDRPLPTRGDPVLLRQVLENIIGNAVKYRDPARSLVIDISVEFERHRPRRVHVADNGLGFDPEKASKIFEPFTRLVSNRVAEGSGVGLATCARICQRLKWEISATGQLGEGAVFSIDLGPQGTGERS